MTSDEKMQDVVTNDSSSKCSFPSIVYTRRTAQNAFSCFMDSSTTSQSLSPFKKLDTYISNTARDNTEKTILNGTAISSLRKVFHSESNSLRDLRPPPLSQTDTFEADTDSEEEEKEAVAPSSNCIGGLLKSKFQILGSSFGSLLGIQVPVRVIDNVAIIESSLGSSASRAPLTPQTAASLNTVSSPCSNSVRSEETFPSLPRLFITDDSRALNSKRTNKSGGHLDGKKRVPLSPRNASLLGSFAEVGSDTFVSSQIDEYDTHVIEVLFMKASKAEIDGNYMLSWKLFQKCLKMMYSLQCNGTKEEQHDQNLQIASFHHSIGTLQWKMGNYEDSLASLKEATNIIKVLTNREGATENLPWNEQLCDILNMTGKVHSSMGDCKLALNVHEESLSIMKDSLDKEGHACSRTYDATNNITGSIEESDGIVLFHPIIARSLICIGIVHTHCGRLGEAMDTLKNGLEIQLKLLGQYHVDIAATLNAIGSVYERSGRHDKAMQCYKKALQIYMREIGDSHVDVAVTMNNIAQIYHHVGKYQKAMETYREALRIMKYILGNTHRNVAAIMFNVGLVHMQCRQNSKALEIFQDTLQLQRAALGDYHVDVALTLERIASIHEQSLKINKALEMYSKALRIRQRTSGDHLFVALTMDKIGKCLMNSNGDTKEALSYFEKSIHIYRQCGISNDEALVREARQNCHLAKSILSGANEKKLSIE